MVLESRVKGEDINMGAIPVYMVIKALVIDEVI